MLIRFSVSNFLSFWKEAEFSMIAGSSERHPSHVTTQVDGLPLLACAVFYGANGSGKSNAFKAISFAKNLVLEGTRHDEEIPLKPFKLSPEATQKPSSFKFEFRWGRVDYAYGFTVEPTQVLEEWLYRIENKDENLCLFERSTKNGVCNVTFGEDVQSTLAEAEPAFLGFVAKGTRPNQLFLTECLEKNIKHFLFVYEWFRELQVIFPASKYRGLGLSLTNHALKKKYVSLLKKFDTGITDLSLEKMAQELPDEIKAIVHENKSRAAEIALGQDRFWLKKEPHQEVEWFKLKSFHNDVPFELIEESDGTRRILDLLPLLFYLEETSVERVVLVDELERSLHPLLARKILEIFFQSRRLEKSQLLLTTHQPSLLDLELFRKDEIWFVEKDSQGASTFFSLEEFSLPEEKGNIQQSYFHGRFGGIPFLSSLNSKS